jgi:hypothetical protein
LDVLANYDGSLKTLKIGNNKIKSLQKVLDFIAKMKLLTKLDLAGNEVCNAEDYREKVMGAIRKN